MRSFPRQLVSLFAALATGCAATAYRPSRTAPGELALRYDGALQVWSADRRVAQAPTFDGLEELVACSPEARRHAEEARRDGSRASILSLASFGLAVAGLGGLSGLALHRDDRAMAGLLVGGIAVEVAAVALAGSSLSAKWKAQGNAIDAVNFYNDAVSDDVCALRR